MSRRSRTPNDWLGRPAFFHQSVDWLRRSLKSIDYNVATTFILNDNNNVHCVWWDVKPYCNCATTESRYGCLKQSPVDKEPRNTAIFELALVFDHILLPQKFHDDTSNRSRVTALTNGHTPTNTQTISPLPQYCCAAGKQFAWGRIFCWTNIWGFTCRLYNDQGRRKLSGRYGGRHTNPER